jgi:hypothetical protein
MTQQLDSKREMRVANTMHEIGITKRSFQTRAIVAFIKMTLACVYMYLIVISYLMLGIAGPVFISILFLVALFVPYFYRVLMDRLEKRSAQKENLNLGREFRQEG